ncbi:DUF1232 domain-containing protein [Pseudomarimonas arenosa]|uniref:DUF1232 domain-containing protein n=1 Tax=Pseudomarimonas arenosa TaxID=2774145 RepID=A0AAW3ZQM0_9GAMM|nr:YkvA family protein [Pseudomarimonas arenosa]MBD8527215.1 DUF1232 domain-containing protein [Pseudomarimonas arenosa]
MSFDIHVSMNEQALAPFRSAWAGAAASTVAMPQADLLQAAREHCQAVDRSRLPQFLQAHLDSFGEVIELLDHPQWANPAMRHALNAALGYFIDDDDLIPDQSSQFGLLDDAIVLELALADHNHEWQAWREYRRFLRDYPQFAALDRDGWMDMREQELKLALRHRRRLRQGYAPQAELTTFRVN